MCKHLTPRNLAFNSLLQKKKKKILEILSPYNERLALSLAHFYKCTQCSMHEKLSKNPMINLIEQSFLFKTDHLTSWYLDSTTTTNNLKKIVKCVSSLIDHTFGRARP